MDQRQSIFDHFQSEYWRMMRSNIVENASNFLVKKADLSFFS